jgi:hypothetical protein
MADNITARANTGSGTDVLASKDISGVQYAKVLLSDAVTGAPLTSFPVTGTFWQATQPVSGPLTDTQLRASAVPVSMTSTTITGSVAVTGPLTDAQLRATAVPVSGTFWQATQPVSAASLPLPSNAAQETGGNLATLVSRTPALGTAAPSASQPVNLSNDLIVGAAASIAALNVDLLTGTGSGWYDAANFHSVTIQVVGSAGITAGAITFEQTNDTTAASSNGSQANSSSATPPASTPSPSPKPQPHGSPSQSAGGPTSNARLISFPTSGR